MADETNQPTADELAAAQDAATAIVASSVADLIVLIQGADLLTLALALDAENARDGGPRKGALAALKDAIAGHPENAVADAAAAEPEEFTPSVPALTDATGAPIPTVIGAPCVGADTPIAMSHPGHGACDRYETAANGNILVPLGEVADMFAFGFVVADAR